MLDITRVKERQREWLPDPTFFSKWKLLYDAKLEEIRKKEMGIIKDGDHVYYVARKEKKGGNANSDGSNSDNSNNDNSNKVYSFPEKTTSRIVTSSSTDLKSGLIDSQSKSTNIQRFQKQTDSEGLIRFNNNSLSVGVRGSMKDYYKKNLENLMKLGSNYQFKEEDNQLEQEINNKEQQQSFIQISNKVRYGDKIKKNKKYKWKIKQNRFDNLFNGNIMQSSGSLTNVNKLKVDEVQEPKIISSKQLTYYDVRHPTTKKIIDRNKGTIQTVTDMGAVYKTTVLTPENLSSYHDVEHRLDEEFKESDKVMHDKQTALRNRNYSPIAIYNHQDQNKGAVFDKYDKKGRLTRHYNYDTTIDIASENQHDIKRVHTNKHEGVKVNTEPYKYGKTMIQSTKDMSPPRNEHIQYIEKTISDQGSESSNTQFCCLVPPCIYLPPCSQQTTTNTKQAQAFIAFIQEKESNQFMQKSQLDSLLDLTYQSKSKTKHSHRHKLKMDQQARIQQDTNFRRRSRFPDPQWNCAYNNIKEQIDYLCNNEMTSSFAKYCKVLYSQFNVLVESVLFMDPIIPLCQNINLCPLGGY